MVSALRYMALGVIGLGVWIMATGMITTEIRKPEQPRVEDVEADLLSNEVEAAGILGKRLRAAVSANGNVVLITKDGTTYAVPKGTDWRISCDKAGLYLLFGADDQIDPAQLVLSEASLDEGVCRVAVPALARAVSALLAQ